MTFDEARVLFERFSDLQDFTEVRLVRLLKRGPQGYSREEPPVTPAYSVEGRVDAGWMSVAPQRLVAELVAGHEHSLKFDEATGQMVFRLV